MREKVREIDMEIHFKDTFRVFSKDEEGRQFQGAKVVDALNAKFPYESFLSFNYSILSGIHSKSFLTLSTDS